MIRSLRKLSQRMNDGNILNTYTKSKWFGIVKAFLIILVATIVNDWVASWIPVNKLPVSHFWQVIAARTLTTLLSLTAMKIFFPKSMSRVKTRISTKRLLVGIGVISYLTLPPLLSSHMFSFTAPKIFEGLIFALFIGIDEEFFSRGFIYASLEGYGVLVATVISSVHFGLLHLGNIFWGGQSVSYTLAQVLTAASFGYLAVGLMLYTGSIWFPILLHGLIDSPMQFEGFVHYTKEVTGHANWVGSLIQAFVDCAIGWILIQLSDPKKVLRLTGWFRSKNLFVHENEPEVLIHDDPENIS